MKVDGKALAEEIYEDLRSRVEILKQYAVTPHLVVVLVGDDPSSKTYVAQKQQKSLTVGIQMTILTYSEIVSEDELLTKLSELNDDPEIHGIIVQRPLPYHIDDTKVVQAVRKEKDIDGFREDSLFDPPVAEAVYDVIEYVHSQIAPTVPLFPWPNDIKVVIVGKGETAGRPVHKLFDKLGIQHDVIDTKTEDPELIIKRADIIVSAVGKKDIIKPEMVKKGAIVIGIGLHSEGEKLRGDYDDKATSEIVSFYTPTPGGIGPLNVAILLKNLVEAAERACGKSS